MRSNELIGDRMNAYRYLADSNLDWEDKEFWIEKFRGGHPEMQIILESKTPQHGFFILGANEFVGVVDEERYVWLREYFKPIRHLEYSHYLFYVPEDRLRKIFPSGPVL